MIFNGIHKSYERCNSFLFEQNEVLMDMTLYLGFAILELRKLHMYETYYDKLQPYFSQQNTQLPYLDTDRFVLKMKTKNNVKDLKK